MTLPLFSVTAADCDWSFTRGTGAGGQKRNKTSSAVHCTHRKSGAHSYSEATRSQLDNRRDAFVKMASTDQFKHWLRMETMRRTGEAATIDAIVERELRRIKVEIKDDAGRWTTVDKDAALTEGEK